MDETKLIQNFGEKVTREKLIFINRCKTRNKPLYV